MKNFLLYIVLLFCLPVGISAQKKKFSYKFYGQVRGDLFYNSRANQETVDGLFYLYPKGHDYDSQGKDMNASPNGSFYVLYSRLGIDLQGPDIGKAKTSAKIETDFRGSGSDFSILRIRHAYVNLDWGKSDVTIGQTWHPMFGSFNPQILNLSTGAPFTAFNRSPQIRYRFDTGKWQLTAATDWQLEYLSAGPEGKQGAYLKNSCVPEIFLGIDFKKDSWVFGMAGELLSIVPRTSSTVNEETFKVRERLTTLSLEGHVKYSDDLWFVAAKTFLASNLTQLSMLGGFAVSAINPVTGEQKYTTFRHSMTSLNIVYGKKWKPGIFIGYLKNLGTNKAIVGETYGVGQDVDQLFTVNAQFSYNLPHWKFGVEYTPSLAWFGTMDKTNGRIHDTYSVCNHRVLGVMIYMF